MKFGERVSATGDMSRRRRNSVLGELRMSLGRGGGELVTSRSKDLSQTVKNVTMHLMQNPTDSR